MNQDGLGPKCNVRSNKRYVRYIKSDVRSSVKSGGEPGLVRLRPRGRIHTRHPCDRRRRGSPTAAPPTSSPIEAALVAQGIAKVKWTAYNQHGEAVYTFTPIAVLARRPDAAS